MDDNQPKRPLEPSDFEDDFYDDEFAFDENDPEGLGADLPPLSAGRPDVPDDLPADSDFAAADIGGQEFEDTPENWGDFEDPAIAAGNAAAASAAAAVKPKSFFMKNFNMIVIGAGVLLGVGVMGSQLMKAPATAPSDMPMEAPMPDMAAVDPSVTGDGSAPPQPSPIAPAEAPPAAAPEQNLTPLPDPAAPASSDNAALAPLDPGPDLGLDNVGVKEGPQDTAQQLDDPALPPIEGATHVEKPVVELPDPIAFENQPIPTSGPAPEEMAAADVPMPAPEAPAVPDPAAMAPADPPQMAMSASQETPAAVLEPVTPPAEAAPVPVPAAEAPGAPVLAEDPAAKAELEKLSADKEVLAERNKALEEEIKGANGKIDELAAMLAKMEEKIAALEQGPGPVTASATAAAEPAPAPAKQASAEDDILVPAKPTQRPATPPAAKKPAVKKTEPKAEPAPKIATSSSSTDAPRWVLRSAQNGRAVVSDRSTGDLRSVQIGDTLRGVGTIQSIAAVNGRWVVQGSQGQVRQ